MSFITKLQEAFQPKSEPAPYQAPNIVAPDAGLTTTGIRDLCPDVTWQAPYPPTRLTPQEARLADALRAEQAKNTYPGGLTQTYYLRMMDRLRTRALRPELTWSFWAGVACAGTSVAVLLLRRR